MNAYERVFENTLKIISELEGRLCANTPSDSVFSRSRPFIIAIDGRCASGKTTLAAQLKRAIEERFSTRVNLFHMDDFFLRPEQRTEKRYATPGENVDHERFYSEVLAPLLDDAEFSYRPFDCEKMRLAAPVNVKPAPVAIIEGSYSCHDALYESYGLRVFLSVEPNVQKRRILLRNGEEKLRQFIEKWIPYEEAYFDACAVKARCDIILDG
ncbi:MAG: uridine kinase [Clostridia bacterium]|nr:uridine kinase [Clostridia bacterium]